MSGLLKGVGYFFRGMSILVQPGLRRFVIIPLLANIAVFALIAGSLYQLMSGLYLDRYSNYFVGRDVAIGLFINFYCDVFDLPS